MISLIVRNLEILRSQDHRALSQELMIYKLIILRSFDFIVSWLNTDHIRSLPRSLPTGSRYRCRCGCYSTRSVVIAAVALVRAPLSSALLPPLPLWSLSHAKWPPLPLRSLSGALPPPPLQLLLRARAALRSRARSALVQASAAASVVIALVRAFAAATAAVALVCS